jgi:hypothetical protein
VIWYERYDTGGYPKPILFNFLQSQTPSQRTAPLQSFFHTGKISLYHHITKLVQAVWRVLQVTSKYLDRDID